MRALILNLLYYGWKLGKSVLGLFLEELTKGPHACFRGIWHWLASTLDMLLNVGALITKSCIFRESVQRRMIKMKHGLSYFPYGERLK